MYNYQDQRAFVFTEEGQVMFLSIRDKTAKLLKSSGACRLQEMISKQSGSTWDMIACVDRLVELNEIKEISQANSCGQHRVFISAKME